MVAVAAHFVLGERTSLRTWTGFGLAIAGAIWLSAGAVGSLGSPNPVLGNFLEFLAMVCSVGYMITLKRMSVRYAPLFITALQALVGTVFYFPLLFLPTTQTPVAADPLGLGAIVYLGAFVTLGAYGLYNYGMSKMPAGQATAFTNLIPVMTLGMGWLFLGERLTLLQYLASGLVLFGVVLSQDSKARKKRLAAPAVGVSENLGRVPRQEQP